MQQPVGSDPLAERVRVSPERTALVRAADGASWTFGRLDDAVERTAGRLAALGIDRGDHVGLLAETGVPAVRTIYAALRLGAVAVPLNARLTAAELAPQLSTADLDALVCERGTEEATVAAAEEATTAVAATDASPLADLAIATLGEPQHAAVTSLAEHDAANFDAPTPDADDLRLLLFTSGTTGDPKAVELTARNLRSSAIASAFRLGIRASVASAGSSDERRESDGVEPDDRWFVPLAIYHMGGFAPVYRSFLYGTTAILQREFDAGITLDRLRERDATCLSVVPTTCRRLLDAAAERSDDATAFATLADLRFVLSGGAATPPDLVERCTDRDVPLCPTYGITETASQVATARPQEAREYEGTVGRPLLPVEVSILETDGGRNDDAEPEPLPPGEAGEIVVDGPTVSPGYYGDPEATDATRSAAGYHTGDLGYRDEGGRLWVLGRADDRLVTGGEVVHPAEVANVLRGHSEIREAAVVGLEDEEWGERVAALVVGDGIAAGDVREHCEGRLAGYKQPRTVAVVDDLPRTPSGTVDRAAVRRQLREDGVEV